MSYFHLDYHSTISKHGSQYALDLFDLFKQVYGSFTPRINCVDSLDRTNACVMYFLEYVGHEHLKQIILRGGNVISRQYASSNAMKQDLAEFGKRTFKGKMQDLATWATRLYANNLGDGKALDAYRLIQGELRVKPQKEFSFLFYSIVMLLILAGSIAAVEKCYTSKYSYLIIIAIVLLWLWVF